MPALHSWIRTWTPWLALLWSTLVLAPFYWEAYRTPSIGVYHDDAIYLGTSRALAAGRGYRIESTPQPIAQTKYPILFPALLAAIWKWNPEFPANVPALKLVPLVASWIWLGLSFLLLRRYGASPMVAVTVVVATAASMFTVFLSTSVLSETLFAALAVGCLLALDWKGGWKSVVLGAVLAAASYHTRSIGVCVIAAGTAALWWRGERRGAALFLGIAVTLATPWLVWQAMHREVQDTYLSQQNYYSSYNIVFNFAWAEKLQVVAMNLWFGLLLPQALFGLSWGVLVGLVAVPLLLRGLWFRGWPLEARLLVTACTIVILLWAWRPDRFWVPLLPLLLYAIYLGVPRKQQTVVLLGFWVLASFGAWQCREISRGAARSGLWLVAPNFSNDWTSFVEQMDWLRLFTGREAVVQCNLDPTVHLLSGRRAIRGSEGNANLAVYIGKTNPLGDAGQYLRTLDRNGVNYVLDTPWPWFDESRIYTGFLEEIQQRHPGRLSLVHTSADGRYRIFRLNSGPLGLK